MTAIDFLIGYTLPLLAMAVAQGFITFLVASLLGLPFSINTPLAILILLPIAVLFVGLGLLCGSFLNDKAVGGICGALLTNIAGWFSGVWIPLDLIGGVFKQTAELLPFYHSVEAAKDAISGNFAGIIPHLVIVSGYAIVFYTLAALALRRKIRDE
jgi:ABC-2 type transport system permease protein